MCSDTHTLYCYHDVYFAIIKLFGGIDQSIIGQINDWILSGYMHNVVILSVNLHGDDFGDPFSRSHNEINSYWMNCPKIQKNTFMLPQD